MAVMRPELIMKSIVPVVMAGIIAIYGLVVSVLISGGLNQANYPLFEYVRGHFNGLPDGCFGKSDRVPSFFPPLPPFFPVSFPFPFFPVLLFLFHSGFIHLGAGLSVGFAGLAAGFAVGIVGDAGVRGTAQVWRRHMLSPTHRSQRHANNPRKQATDPFPPLACVLSSLVSSTSHSNLGCSSA